MSWSLLHHRNTTLPSGPVAGRIDREHIRYDGTTRTYTGEGAHRHVGYFERVAIDEGVRSAKNSGAGGFFVGKAVVAPREKSSEESARRERQAAGICRPQREER